MMTDDDSFAGRRAAIMADQWVTALTGGGNDDI
jgi:hypothetical protein